VLHRDLHLTGACMARQHPLLRHPLNVLRLTLQTVGEQDRNLQAILFQGIS
jgi:hypothetical protein